MILWAESGMIGSDYKEVVYRSINNSTRDSNKNWALSKNKPIQKYWII